MKLAGKAVAEMQRGFHCSQAVLSVFAEEYALERDLALKIASTLGGGMGYLGNTCGAVTGAYLVIGLIYGPTRPDDLQASAQAMRLVQVFDREFKTLHGTTVCRELINCDISSPAGLQKAREENIFTLKCLKYVADAVEILEKIL